MTANSRTCQNEKFRARRDDARLDLAGPESLEEASGSPELGSIVSIDMVWDIGSFLWTMG